MPFHTASPTQDPNVQTTQDFGVNLLTSAPSQLTQQGLDTQVAGAGVQGQIAGQTANSLGFLLDPNLLNAASNPYVSQVAEGATQTVFQQLMEQVLPQIRSGAGQAGQVGSSRQGITEGRAIEGATRQANQATAQIYNQNYQNSLGAMLQALGLGSQVGAQQTQEGQTIQNVGDYDINKYLALAPAINQGQQAPNPTDNIFSTLAGVAGTGLDLYSQYKAL